MADVVFKLIEIAHHTHEVIERLDGLDVPGVRFAVFGRDGPRMGLPLFEHDPCHDDYLAKGMQPAFPSQSDLPESENVSFDVWYIPAKDNPKVVHRVTASRCHDSAGANNVVFVDGNLLFLKVKEHQAVVTTVFEYERFNAGTDDRSMTNLWFSIGGWKVGLLANATSTLWSRFWLQIIRKNPHNWGIFIDDHCVQSGLDVNIVKHKSSRCCPNMLPMVLLWPVWILWLLLGFFVLSCFVFCCCAPEIRRFHATLSRMGSLQFDDSQHNAQDGEKQPLL